jgi:hypothetical protein
MDSSLGWAPDSASGDEQGASGDVLDQFRLTALVHYLDALRLSAS